MAISKKIENEIERINENEDFKNLMINILQEEARGIHNFKAKYDELINNYINNNIVGVVDNDQDR